VAFRTVESGTDVEILINPVALVGGVDGADEKLESLFTEIDAVSTDPIVVRPTLDKLTGDRD